jgi:hypothetical protein
MDTDNAELENNIPGVVCGDYCLEVQLQWSQLLLSGKKTIEIRQYILPSCLVDKPVYILQSPTNTTNKSSLDDISKVYCCVSTSKDYKTDTNNNKETDSFPINDIDPTISIIVGMCVFSGIKTYNNEYDFLLDSDQHLVHKDSDYNVWNSKADTVTECCLYGWIVKEVKPLNEVDVRTILEKYQSTTTTTSRLPIVTIHRRKRSIFEFIHE